MGQQGEQRRLDPQKIVTFGAAVRMHAKQSARVHRVSGTLFLVFLSDSEARGAAGTCKLCTHAALANRTKSLTGAKNRIVA